MTRENYEALIELGKTGDSFNDFLTEATEGSQALSSLDAVSKATRILDAIDNHVSCLFRLGELRERGFQMMIRNPLIVLKIRREIDMIDLRNVESVGNADLSPPYYLRYFQ